MGGWESAHLRIMLGGIVMGLISMIKSALNRSGDSPQEVEEQAQNEVVSAQIIPAFDPGMPIEIMQDYDTVLIYGKLGRINAMELVVDRIPGVMSFPVLEAGSTVRVRGYDDEVNPILMEAKVVRSSVVECVLGDWLIQSYENLRKSIRYPLSPPADIYAMEDTRLNSPETCQLINISTGGACITSKHAYAMGEALRLRVELIKNAGHTSYQCQVVRIIPRRDGSFEYGLLFAQLDKKKMGELLRDIESIQRDTQKKLLS